MVERKYLPLVDQWDEHVPGTLTWLQAWFAMQVDGDWEHEDGITIETLDNPGWAVSISLAGTSHAETSLPEQAVHRSEHDWHVVKVENREFRADCGPLNLGEVLHLFRLLVEGEPQHQL